MGGQVVNNIDGLLYLLNQAGATLAERDRQMAQLAAEIESLRAQLAAQAADPPDGATE